MADIEQILKDPKRFGFPTFKEFRQNPDKYRVPKTMQIDSAVNGVKSWKAVKKHNYILQLTDGRRIHCGTKPEHLDKELASHGLNWNHCMCEPQMKEDHSTGIEIDVVFRVKSVAEELGLYLGGPPR